MKKAIRIALGSAVLAGGLAVVGASPANAQVRFEGSFPLPHGRISIGVGDAGFPIGGYVPDGYSVYDNPEYGYGFEYGDQWIPCEQYGTRWVISASPIFFGHRDYGYGRTYRNDSYSYSRDSRYDNRGYGNHSDSRYENRSYGNHSYDTRAYNNRSYDTRAADSRSYGNRTTGRDDRQLRDNRSSQRDNQRSRDQNRRSRW